MEPITAQQLLDTMGDWLTGPEATEAEVLGAHADITVRTFEEAGVLSGDAGLVVRVRRPGGREQLFQIRAVEV